MEDKIILIDKPTGISSFGVVAKVRQKLTQKFGHKIKVGHTGTLDPFATGLLILLTGKMTKKSNDFLKLDKVYEATLKLGYTSTTGDPEGKITEATFSKHGEVFPKEKPNDSPDFYNISPLKNSASNASIRNFSEAENVVKINPREYYPSLKKVTSVISSFMGKITQQVPKFSAVKINGKRAYKLAREGKDFEPPIRNVTIYNIELLDYHYPELKIRCHVSSGTYIRTLAEDIGKKLGTGAYLTSLRRIKIGNYDVKDAIIDLC
ncbi:tRNA pseudouridine(55) synthase TruB [Candidatus Saccharibacteria bacterium]|nr:tRNA pseudouridine(55) synthase TruB [Candidatus Saccharibacteria bacterium]